MKAIEPKAEFMNSAEGSAFAEMKTTPTFGNAIKTALQQMVMDQNTHTRFEEDARAHVELQGAKRFIDILLNLTTADKPRKPDTSGVLQCHSKPPQPHQSQKAPKPPVLPRI